MSFSSYMQSPEFKRASSTVIDNALKKIFKGLGILISGTAKFIKSTILMSLGK